MKNLPRYLLIACTAVLPIVCAQAAEPSAAVTVVTSSPTGTWTWKQSGRDGASYEQTLQLAYTDGKLTGTLLGGQRPQGAMPDVAIQDGTFQNGTVAFSVAREFNGNRFVTKYEGKLDGDTITGTSERPGRDGGTPQKRDWVATRSK
jgi:hypothetical protein